MSDMAPTNAPLLSFERKERAWVEIYGEPYFIRDRDELGLEDLAKLDAIVREYGTLIQRAHEGQELSVADGKRLDPALDQVCRVFLEAPDKVHDELKPGQRLRLVLAFNSALPPASETAPRPMNREQRRSMPASSRPRSNASTAATPSAG